MVPRVNRSICYLVIVCLSTVCRANPISRCLFLSSSYHNILWWCLFLDGLTCRWSMINEKMSIQTLSICINFSNVVQILTTIIYCINSSCKSRKVNIEVISVCMWHYFGFWVSVMEFNLCLFLKICLETSIINLSR